jgi:hypothetical protein
MIREVLINKPAGKRPSGRLRQRWQDRVNADIKMIDEIADIETATNRDVWRGLVEATKGRNSPYSKKKKKRMLEYNYLQIQQ